MKRGPKGKMVADERQLSLKGGWFRSFAAPYRLTLRTSMARSPRSAGGRRHQVRLRAG